MLARLSCCGSIEEMKIARYHSTCLLAAAALLCLSSCKPNNAATEEAAQELNELRDRDIPSFFHDDAVEDNAEESAMQATIRAFSKSQNVHAANEYGMTMLHLACLFKKRELARCLLLDGADPNRRVSLIIDGETIEGEDALDFVFYGINENSKADDIIALVDLLVKHGGKINRDDASRPRLLDLAGSSSYLEELFLYILKQTNQPLTPQLTEDGSSISPLTWPALNLWPESLKLLIEMGADATATTGVDQFPLLYIVFNGHEEWTDKTKECAEILIAHGADITACDNVGRETLFGVCKILVEQRKDDFDELGLIDKVAYLLEKGADPYRRAYDDVVYPGFCAYDFLLMRPSVLTALREKGFELKEPELDIPGDEVAFLATLCRAQQTDMQPQEFAPHLERLKGILTPSPEIAGHELYPTAVEVALKYMIAIDELEANAFISELPAWYSERDWSKLDAQITPLLHALQDIREYKVESKILLFVAFKLKEAGEDSSAIEVLQMLSRCPDREAITANLLSHDCLVMRCGGLFAELLAANLPLPKDGKVEAWLTQRDQIADSEVLKKAVQLTSQSEFWYGNMSEEGKAALLQAMSDIGATQAVEKYKLIGDNMDSPQVLDEIMSGDMSWYLELEALTAAYIWEHRDEFFEKAKAAPQTPEAHQPLPIHEEGCGCCH